MSDHPSTQAITYAKAAQILGVKEGTIRYMVSTGVLFRPEQCKGIGAVIEMQVLQLERDRRFAAGRRVGLDLEQDHQQPVPSLTSPVPPDLYPRSHQSAC